MSEIGARMIIVAAPSGAGKSSFVERLTRENSHLVDLITYTTRSMRAGESQGAPYYFVSREEFEEKVRSGFFVEWAKVHTNLYGTPLDQIEAAWANGKAVIMDIDIQGADTLKTKFPDAVLIFILPPSIEELKRRVMGRPGGPPPDLDVRMQNAIREIAASSRFDYRVINDQFEPSYAEFKNLVETLIRAK